MLDSSTLDFTSKDHQARNVDSFTEYFGAGTARAVGCVCVCVPFTSVFAVGGRPHAGGWRGISGVGLDRTGTLQGVDSRRGPAIAILQMGFAS